ncbi:MAG: NRDE family protein [Novosphingobium sp.]|nr:NRDE family protein [Novosphingobium sp.]
MCVAALAWQAHPDWQLVAIGNRDEFHERPAAPLARWDDGSGIIGGRDLKSGGTWLGISEDSRFVLVTNRRGFGEPQPDKASRGTLVTDLLSGNGNYSNPATLELGDFNPFNLFAANGDGLHFLANHPEATRTMLIPGIYGLSNGALDEPWPKTLALKSALLEWLGGESENADELFGPLASEALPAVGLHPDAPSDIAAEAFDTAPFIRHPVYGTRCSTVVAVARDGKGRIIERRFDHAGNPTGDTDLSFEWAG